MMVIKIMIMTQPNIRHRKRTYNEEDNSEDYFENAVYEDSVNFSSMADYEDFLIWGTDNKDQFI